MRPVCFALTRFLHLRQLVSFKASFSSLNSKNQTCIWVTKRLCQIGSRSLISRCCSNAIETFHHAPDFIPKLDDFNDNILTNQVFVKPGVLYLVATPIGNLTDVTLRALQVLLAVDIIAAEDTRRSLNLLRAYYPKCKKLPIILSYNEHSNQTRVNHIIAKLKAGHKIAVTSDAGTPGVCDPGDLLVRACIQEGLQVIAVPGACAAVAAVVSSGIVTGQWLFRGFLPQKGSERKKAIHEISNIAASVVLYEAPHRLVGLLELIAQDEREKGERQIALVRELTKKYEQVLRFENVTKAKSWLDSPNSPDPRGEYTVILGPIHRKKDDFTINNVDTRKLLKHLVDEGVTPSAAAKAISSALSVPRKPLYSLALSLNAQQ